MLDTRFSVKELNAHNRDNLASTLGMEFTEITPDHLSARMPVDERTRQPLGLLHGGANAALAESLGSMASLLCLDRKQFFSVGLELKTNHLKPALHGHVYGTASAIHIGKKTHVWQIRIKNEDDDLSAFSTLTCAVLPVNEQILNNPMFKAFI